MIDQSIQAGDEQPCTIPPPAFVIKREVDLDKLEEEEELEEKIVDEEDLEENTHLSTDIEYIEHILEEQHHISSTPVFWRYQGLWREEHYYTRPATLNYKVSHYSQGDFEGQLPEDQRDSPATWHFIGTPTTENIFIRTNQLRGLK